MQNKKAEEEVQCLYCKRTVYSSQRKLGLCPKCQEGAGQIAAGGVAAVTVAPKVIKGIAKAVRKII